MAVAALVLGIVSVVISFIPFCGTWAIIPAIVGLVLGIIDLVKKKGTSEPKGKSIAGVVCSGIAVVIIAVWWMIAGSAAKKLEKELESVDWNQVIESNTEEENTIDLNDFFNSNTEDTTIGE